MRYRCPIVCLFQLLVLLSARDRLCLASTECPAGSYFEDELCLSCPSRHFCKGGGEPPSMCPANSFDFHATDSTKLDDCACDAGYFRTDNTVALALALAQNGLTLRDSRVLWCVQCPIGHFCNTMPDSTSPRTHVEKCPAMSTTLTAGASVADECLCMPGSYAEHANSSSCVECMKKHFCLGQSIPPTVCPQKTVSNRGATSVAGCICLPPLVMLPTASPLFLYDCVVQSATAFTDVGVTQDLQTQQYDIFGMEAGNLYETYAVAPSTQCTLIETGVNSDPSDCALAVGPCMCA